jgi:hypothetical protein
MQAPWYAEEPSDALLLPSTPLAREAMQLLTRSASPSIANHGILSYLFARLAADERGLRSGRDYDAELLFCACALHDIGVTAAFDKGQRFEVNGADAAAELLRRHGTAEKEVDLVWQAIALNTSPGIVERRGTLCALTLAGVAIDFGIDAPFVTDETAASIHRAYPRLSIGRVLSDAIAVQAGTDPAKAPLFSASAQLVRQRLSAPHVTEIESIAANGRWRE